MHFPTDRTEHTTAFDGPVRLLNKVTHSVMGYTGTAAALCQKHDTSKISYKHTFEIQDDAYEASLLDTSLSFKQMCSSEI